MSKYDGVACARPAPPPPYPNDWPKGLTIEVTPGWDTLYGDVLLVYLADEDGTSISGHKTVNLANIHTKADLALVIRSAGIELYRERALAVSLRAWIEEKPWQ